VGSPAEQQFVAGVLAPFMGDSASYVPASLEDLLVGPMLRGMAVKVS
jgi:hypothetical protein